MADPKDPKAQDQGSEAAATPPKAATPTKAAAQASTPKVKYLAIVNPSGEVVTLNDDEKGREKRLELLRIQKPPEVETAKWWRDASSEEIAAYQENTGHFYVGENAKRKDWEKRRSEQ
jgi:hypothetical protein